jgi:hydrogenase maturation protein HypF
MPSARRIRVTGIVQGVGFRPFVWRIARELELAGWVRNDANGVEIAAEGARAQVEALLWRLRNEAPALARVDAVQSRRVPLERLSGFAIAPSRDGAVSTAIGPDVGLCPACVAELFDPAARRWRHGFITCTHCGPRYTVTRRLPYDRPNTSLAPFGLCPDCAAEYGNPADRRFHAETTCCPNCGPTLTLRDAAGSVMAGDPIERTLALLRGGAIVAIKGLGGFHLACDARNGAAVAALRQRKDREAKPFAVMVAGTPGIAPLARVSPPERELLESRERPVVLLQGESDLDAMLPHVAPGLRSLGVMLPATPIQYLLFHEAAGRPSGTDWLQRAHELVLVMTSANPGGEPIVRTNEEALARLAGIADAILDHDREIVARCDDTVVRAQPGGAVFVRRSRGHAPLAIKLPRAGRSVLAFGSHLKNCVCVTRGDEAFLSPHVGDLDTSDTCEFLDETVRRLCELVDVEPRAVAHDLHPDDYASRAALAYARERSLPAIAVQHHHAHIAAVCAEHRHDGPALGLALDGVGLGDDGSAWGGELLHVDGPTFRRVGRLRPLPLPGGDRAAREPWRMAAAALHELGLGAVIGDRFDAEPARGVALMLERDLHCPRTSSLGRVFDAAAGLLGLCSRMQYEPQAAMLLEQAAWRFIARDGWPQPIEHGWRISADGELDLLPLLADLVAAQDPLRAAARFHATLAAALAQWTAAAAASAGLRTIALGGGCLLNALLATALHDALARRGLQVLTARQAPPGDGGVALGQAWVASQAGGEG